MTATPIQPNPMDIATTETLRTANVEDLVALLQKQGDIKHDMVCSAGKLRYEQGLLVVEGAAVGDVRIGDDGELSDSTESLRLRPTAGFESDVSERLSIPHKYIQRMRADAQTRWNAEDEESAFFAADLLDHNVNHWLADRADEKFLVRAFHSGESGEVGIARALRSDRFGMYDHMDMLLAALSGVQAAGVAYEVTECRLTERQMHVRIVAPEITVAAQEWTRGYRSPFQADGGGSSLERQYDWSEHGTNRWGNAKVGDAVAAGVDFRNSETGDGSWWFAPWILQLACLNGLTVKREAFTRAHLGSKMDEGLIRYSDDTHRKNIDLIMAQSRDAVATFLDVEYLQARVDEIEEKAGAPVKKVEETIERVAKKFLFSEDEQNAILAAFISSGQVSAGGVMNAVTAAAQVVENIDRATRMEETALDVLDFVAAAA